MAIPAPGPSGAASIPWCKPLPASTMRKEMPAQILDHATGYLMAFGAMMAKMRQAREGGSWHVRVSLAQTGRWLWNIGRLAEGLKTPDFYGDEIKPYIEEY